jgi:hypothetical protein
MRSILMRGSDSELGDLHLIPSGGTYAEAAWLWRKDKCVPDANLFSVYGRMTTLPGRREEVIDLIKESVRAGGDDSGLHTYSISVALDDPDTIRVTPAH